MADDALDKAPQHSNGSPAVEQRAHRGSATGDVDAVQDQVIESADPVSVSLLGIRATLKQVDAQLHQLESQLQPGVRLQPSTVTRWQLSARQGWFLSLALLTALLVVGVRLFQLNTIQTDVYGDIQIVHQYVDRVRSGKWPFEYVLGVGPLYQYVITPVIVVTGLNYYGLKLGAVIVSLGALLATYALARRLIADSFALLTITIAGVSSWLLIFSRLGISLILVPALATCALWLVVRIAQEQRPADVVACAVVSALGLYTYPQSVVLPGVSFITLVCLRWIGHPISWADLRRFVLVSLVGALPFAWMVYQAPENFTAGYIGSKFVAEGDPLRALIGNVVAAALAFHVRGDSIFRSNPANLPHLDQVSGLLFLAGVVFWLRPARRRWSPALLVPFVLLQLPSVLVLGRSQEVPSAGRTLGVAPIAYILVASGMWWLVQSFARLGRRRLGLLVAGGLLGAILLLNMQRYFGTYISELPYHDTSIGERIAVYADSLPPDTQIYVVGCCWERAMPEVPFIQLMAARPQNLQALDPKELTCDRLALLRGPAVLIWSFRDPVPVPQLTSCKQWLPAQLYMSPKGWPVFYAAPLLSDRLSAPATASSTAGQPAEQLEYTEARLDGQTIRVGHSALDIGRVVDIFDQNQETLIRGREANPLVLELHFAQPREVNAIGFDLTAMQRFRIKVELSSIDGEATSFEQEYQNLPAAPHVDMLVPHGPRQASVVRIEIEDQRPKPLEGYHVHMRELQLR